MTEQISDPRQDSYDRVIGVINQVEEMTQVGEQGRGATLPDGVSGFFGLGVYQVCQPFPPALGVQAERCQGQQAVVTYTEPRTGQRKGCTLGSYELCGRIRHGSVQSRLRGPSWKHAFRGSPSWGLHWQLVCPKSNSDRSKETDGAVIGSMQIQAWRAAGASL